MATKKKRKLMLDCDICGEPVYLSPERYLQLIKAGEKPRCRKNGCERLCGAKNTMTARVLDIVDVPLVSISFPVSKKGNKNGALAKLRVEPDQDWRKQGAVEMENEKDA